MRLWAQLSAWLRGNSVVLSLDDLTTTPGDTGWLRSLVEFFAVIVLVLVVALLVIFVAVQLLVF